MRMPRRFTWIELICLALVGVFVLAAMLSAQSGAREAALRIRCRDNLRQIGQAIMMYANNETRNGNAFPRVHFDLNGADHPKFFTAWKQPHSFGEGAPTNDVTAAMYLILKTQDALDPATFVCPSTRKRAMTFADQRPKPAQSLANSRAALSNFPGMDYVSYSFQDMYAGPDALMTGWKWNLAIRSDVAIAADLNPGGKAVSAVKPNSPAKDLAAANSPNHARAGQNVLYGDGTVEFRTTPFCGAKMDDGTADNIYCRRAGAKGDPIYGPPMDISDSVLLPTADYKAEK
jgi:hypothetical protein